MFTFLEHAHMSLTSMFDVTEQVGWGGAVFRLSRVMGLVCVGFGNAELKSHIYVLLGSTPTHK